MTRSELVSTMIAFLESQNLPYSQDPTREDQPMIAIITLPLGLPKIIKDWLICCPAGYYILAITDDSDSYYRYRYNQV